LDGWQYQLRSFILNRPSFSVTSVGVMAASMQARVSHRLGERGRGGSRASRRTVGQVLLVGKDEQETVLHLAVVENLVELDARLVDAVAVLRVDDEHEALSARVVVPPQGPNLVLPADILCVRCRRVSLTIDAADGRTVRERERTQTLNLRRGRERCQRVQSINWQRVQPRETGFSSQALKEETTHLTFLYVTVSTLKPTVGMVVTDWLSLSL